MCQNIIEWLFLKRFCLPVNSNVEDYENGTQCINKCYSTGNFNHISCTFEGNLFNRKNKVKILTCGINVMPINETTNNPGMHAEHNALRKLCLRKNRYKKSINLLVVRLSSKNKLQYSKPCHSCIRNIETITAERGYKIKNIYYSNECNSIVKTNLETLKNEDMHYTRFYRTRQR
jgi:hypothetical protein